MNTQENLGVKSVEEADKFLQIVPEGEEMPEMEKKDGVCGGKMKHQRISLLLYSKQTYPIHI